MGRITTAVFVMMLLLNGSTTVMEVSGFSDDIGINIETGVDETASQIVSEVRNGFSPNVNVIESFISLAVAAGRTFMLLIEGVFTLPTLLINIFGGGEVVSAIVTAFMAPLYVIAILELISLMVGNRTL